jgi:hypothetical protein
MRPKSLALLAGAFALACTDPVPPRPLDGTFALNAHFVGREQRTIPCNTGGCTFKYDTTAVQGLATGKVMFDSAAGAALSSVAALSLGQCDFCTISHGSSGSALRSGDSVRVSVQNFTASLRLLGVYAGDTIAGRIEAADVSGGVNNVYFGTFVLKPTERDPQVSFIVRGSFDSLTTTDGQGHIATRAAISDSLRGPLILDDITTAPIGHFTAEKCGSCFGYSLAAPAAYSGFTGAGTRNGDSLWVPMIWDLMSGIQFHGVYRGDSIVGVMESHRGTSTSTTYTGTFVARRNP